MKKQTITAAVTYLLGGTFFLALLFLLGSAIHAGPAKRAPNVPTVSVSAARFQAVRIPPAPNAPQVVLYDQYNSAGGAASLSATFTDFPTFSSDLADDFVVPAGQTWNVQSIDADGVYFNGAGPATSWNVYIYSNSGTLPGAQIFSATNQPVTQVGTTFTVNLPVAAVLTAGTYWIEIQANMTFGTQGEWGWSDRTLLSNSPAAFQNPGGGLGVCPTWAPKLATCIPTASGPDQVYRLNGTLGGSCTVTPWALVASMPQDLYGAAAASNGTYSYHAGGYSFTTGTTLNVFNRFDPVANTWTPMAPMVDANGMASAVYYPTTNKIYVFGGEDLATGVNSNATRIYDIATNTWGAGANMPDIRSFMASGYNSANGKIYLVSGYNTGNVTSAQPDTWEYDPVANTFTSKAPFPHPTGGAASGVIGGHLYVAGGRDAANTVINLVWDYDIAANTWTPKANMPAGNTNVTGSGVALNNLWAFGGGNPFSAGGQPSSKAAFAAKGAKGQGQAASKAAFAIEQIKGQRAKGQAAPDTTNGTVRYNPATDAWFSAPNMNVVRAFVSGTAIGSKLIAAGGYNGSTTVASAETLDPCIPSVVCTPCPPYIATTGAGVIVPGTTDIGNHCDDCPSPVTLPFAVTFYGTTYPAGATLQASSNGSLDFVGLASPFGTSCPLPDARIDRSILPFQGDLYTVNSGYGIFTSVTGSAPNRDFNIEWRAQYFPGSGNNNFEIVLHENTNCFDVIYGASDDSGASEESGVQGSPAGPALQFSCLTGTLTAGLKVTYCPTSCPAPVPTSAVSRKVHGGAGTFDINLPLVPIGGAVGIEDRQQGAASPINLWYNGDFNNVNGLANEINTNPVTQASVYDNFVVTNAAGWDITDVYSDDLISTVVTGATWEIRSGVSAGNGGTLVASGSTLTPTVTPTGRSGFGFTEYQVKVSGLSVHLPQLPAGQFYWLNVTVQGDGTGRAFDSQTSGLNAIGIPPGNDTNAFLDSTFFGNVFTPTCDPTIAQCADFSMGVVGLSGGVGGFNHQMVVTFATPVTVGSATVTTGSASVASYTVVSNVVTINLTGVADVQRVGVTLGDVCDGTNQGNVLIPMGVLAGDTGGNGSVSAADVGQTKAQSGNPAGAGNFREDVNASGSVSAADVGLVKAKSGHSLPP